MGSRGPLPDPHSRRSQRRVEKARRRLERTAAEHRINKVLDGRTVPTTDEQGGLLGADGPQCPVGLPVRVERIWLDLVADLKSAKVPVEQVDTYAILQVARCLHRIAMLEEQAEDATLPAKVRMDALEMSERYEKRLDTLLPMIGATPGSRARIGIKRQPAKAKGPLERLLERKAGAGGQPPNQT